MTDLTIQPDELLLAIEAAQERILAAIAGPLGSEEVPVAAALGRVAAAAVRATTDLPPWDNSAMDGYAVHVAPTWPAPPSSCRSSCAWSARPPPAARSGP